MKALKYIFIISAILLASCGKEEAKYNIPDSPVNFTFNTNALDTHLAGAGNVAIYLLSRDKSDYDKLLAGVSVAKSYNAERTQASLVGYSGLLVINTGSLLGNTPFAAFDLCCPYEAQMSTRIVPTNNGTAECPKCKSSFMILNGTGKAVSGPAEKEAKNLKPYSIERRGESEYRVIH